MLDLFSAKKNIQIVKLNIDSVNFKTDDLRNFRESILSNEQMYPNIEKWYKNKVIPGIKSGERVAYIGYYNEKPMISAVVKKGKKAKFCHLRIGEDFQKLNIGEMFFSLMALEVRHMAKEIHFTLPESLWISKKDFFNSFGFNNFIKAKNQYRSSEDELFCSTPFNQVWDIVLKKIPKLMYHYSLGGYTNDNSLVFSIKPVYIDKILSGEKSIEIRRKFSKKWLGEKVSLYSSSPDKALVGYAIIKNIIVDKPSTIWEKFNKNIGVNKQEFDRYTSDMDKIFAIFLDNVHAYQNIIPLSQISHLIKKDLTPPQSYYSLSKNKDWRDAISMATLLHANFSKQNIITI